MQYYGKLKELDIFSIYPEGWFRKFLKTQKSGLTGHIENAGYPFDCIGWDKIKAEFSSEDEKKYIWTAYEQTAYALDGQVRCAALLKDNDWLKNLSQKIQKALNEIDSDGFIGPPELKEPSTINRWPHTVFFRAVSAYYGATNDKIVLDKIVAHYLNKPIDYSYGRNALNIEIMLWAFSKSGNSKLLEMAIKTFEEFDKNEGDCFATKNLLSKNKSHSHGVSYNEISKLGVLLYLYTGADSYLKPALHGYDKVFKYQILPDGLHSCNENMSDNNYRETHELCNVSDFTWTMGYILQATGDAKYADRIERCIFNAGIGAVLEDFKGIQYFSGLNQIIADDTSNHNWYYRGSSWMAYRPNHITPCCTGNCNRFFPNFVARSVLKTDNGIAVVFYGDLESETIINNSKCHIKENTDYPFDDVINITLYSESTIELLLRIPSWCIEPKLSINGKNTRLIINKGFAKIENLNGENNIQLILPSKAAFVNYGDGVFVEKGSLLFALGMKGKRELSTLNNGIESRYPKFNIYADKPWNYALNTKVEPIYSYDKNEGDVWSIETCPCHLTVKARKVSNWKTRKITVIKTTKNPERRNELTKKGNFIFTPPFPKKLKLEKEETIELVPFGAAKMRISVFPKINNEE